MLACPVPSFGLSVRRVRGVLSSSRLFDFCQRAYVPLVLIIIRKNSGFVNRETGSCSRSASSPSQLHFVQQLRVAAPRQRPRPLSQNLTVLPAPPKGGAIGKPYCSLGPNFAQSAGPCCLDSRLLNLALSVTCGDSSPKGRANCGSRLAAAKSGICVASPFGRGGNAPALTERAHCGSRPAATEPRICVAGEGEPVFRYTS